MLVPLAVLALMPWRVVRWTSLAALVAIIYALRDPERTIADGDDALAAADGDVIDIRTVFDEHFQREMREFTIFLWLWSVHVQRAPLAGRVLEVVEIGGPFLPARLAAAAENCRQTLYLETDWGPCSVSLIAGWIARRIVRWVEPGEMLERGQRIGMIRFGSRVSIRLPLECEPLVRVGQKVQGGLTPIARRRNATPSP